MGVGGLHILGCFGNGDVKVQVEAEDCARDEHDEDGESGVFKVGDLDFHWAKFNPPASVFVVWWRLEAHVLPVGGLQIFKVVGFVKVEGFEVFSEDDNGVTDEEVCKMGG